MCWFCGLPIVDEEPIGRSLRCAQCGKDLRSCRHCRFYLPGSRNDCAEPETQPPADRDRANFCDWFSLDMKFRAATKGRNVEMEKASAAKSAFDNLFS